MCKSTLEQIYDAPYYKEFSSQEDKSDYYGNNIDETKLCEEDRDKTYKSDMIEITCYSHDPPMLHHF